jgi:hypothetical protein
MNYELLIQKAKKEINDGFNNMGRKIENPSFLEIYLIVSTLKAIKLSDTIVFLCKNNFSNESLIILRSLIEHSVNMHWIMKEDTEKRLEDYRSDLEKLAFGERWTNTDLSKRLESIGFNKDKEYYDYVVKFTYSYAHVNAKSLKWENMIKIEGLKSVTFPAQAIYSIVAQMLGHVLKSLNIHFSGLFATYSNIWKEIEVDKNSIRKKIEEIAKNLGK